MDFECISEFPETRLDIGQAAVPCGAGLLLVDAVCLSWDEFQEEVKGRSKVFRVRTQRRKTGAHINNVIPCWLGKELLKVKNGNPNRKK